MLCRMLRNLSVGRGALAGILCLALAWGTASPTRLSFLDDGDTSIGLRARDVPLAALEANSGVRFQKQGQAIRLTFTKLERRGHLSSIERSCGAPVRAKGCHRPPLSPRRFLPPRHATPRAPNDAGDPLLVSLSLA